MIRMLAFWTIGNVSVASVKLILIAVGLIGFGTSTMASQPLPGSTDGVSDEYKPPQPSTGLSD